MEYQPLFSNSHLQAFSGPPTRSRRPRGNHPAPVSDRTVSHKLNADYTA